MPREGSNNWYRAYADRFYLDKANKDLYLYRSSSSKLGLNAGLVVPALETIDGVDVSAHAADLDAHGKLFSGELLVGQYYNISMASSGAIAGTTNRMYAIPFIVPRKMTFDRIAITVTVGASGKSARLGIYNDNGSLYPGTLALDAGVVDCTSAATVTITISKQLAKGIYWLVLLSESTQTYYACSIASPFLLGVGTGTIRNGGYYVAQAYGALPDPFTAGGTIDYTSNMPDVAVRLASLDT